MKSRLSRFLLRQNLPGRLILLAVGLNFFSMESYSQSPGKDETLSYINQVLGQRTEVNIRSGTILVKFYDQQAQYIREDKVPSPDLDLPMYYEAENNLLCIPCAKDVPGCVTRTLVVQKVKKAYDRLSIPVTDEAMYKRLEKAFDHLIRLYSEDGYKNEISLD